MDEMSRIVKTISSIVYPLVLIFGFYIILHGHITPGGGFQGGAIVATAFAMIIISFGAKRTEELFNEDILSLLESIGGLGFVSIGFLGLGTVFLANFLIGTPIFGQIPPTGPNPGILNSGGILPPLNIFVGLKVLAGLGSIVIAFATWEGKK